MTGRGRAVWIAACCAPLLCAGCGFKGPLYLPERNATVVTHPAQPAGQAQAPAARKKNATPPPPTVPQSSPTPSAPPPQ